MACGHLLLTVEATPPSDVAGLVVREDDSSSRKTSSHDAVGEGDGGLQLDQGDVITADQPHMIRSLPFLISVRFCSLIAM